MNFNNHARNLLSLAAALVLFSACSDSGESADTTVADRPPMDLLVTSEWLSEHLDDADLVVLDTTVLVEMDESGGFQIISGQASYDTGHIPGARFADLLGDLSDQDSDLQFVMPSPEQFAVAMGALGVGNNSRVVLYSASDPDWAARVWWMLRWAGFDQVALLDGGQQAWVADGRALSTEPAEYAPQQFKLSLRPETIADRDEVLAATSDTTISIVDAMADGHYRGDFSMYARPGHILGATNMPSSNLLDETGHYRAFDELEMLHGDDRDGRAITYCGGGVAAASVAFTMHRLGYKDVAVYMGSLQEWAPDPENPMSVGSQ